MMISYLIFFSLSTFFLSFWIRHRFVSEISLPQDCHVQLSRWFTAQGVTNMKMRYPDPLQGPAAQLQGE